MSACKRVLQVCLASPGPCPPQQEQVQLFHKLNVKTIRMKVGHPNAPPEASPLVLPFDVPFSELEPLRQGLLGLLATPAMHLNGGTGFFLQRWTLLMGFIFGFISVECFDGDYRCFCTRGCQSMRRFRCTSANLSISVACL